MGLPYASQWGVYSSAKAIWQIFLDDMIMIVIVLNLLKLIVGLDRSIGLMLDWIKRKRERVRSKKGGHLILWIPNNFFGRSPTFGGAVQSLPKAQLAPAGLAAGRAVLLCTTTT